MRKLENVTKNIRNIASVDKSAKKWKKNCNEIVLYIISWPLIVRRLEAKHDNHANFKFIKVLNVQ